MSLKPIRYPLDLTGESPDNAVVNELHTLKPTKIRVFVPTYGGFFTNSFVLRDVANNQVLIRGKQYNFDNLFEMASIDAKQEVAGVVVITDQNVSNNISCDYQAIGGLYGYSNEAIMDQIEALKLDERPVEWGNIFNKPAIYPPAPHLHDIGDVYGFEYIVHALQQIRQAILTGDDGSHTIIYQYIDANINKTQANINKVDDKLNAHIADKENPHNTTAHQTGAYTQAEVDAMIKVLTDAWREHVNNHNNPHNTTAAQVGAYSKEQIDAMFAALQNGILADVAAHLKDFNNPHHVTAAQTGAYSKDEVNELLKVINENLAAHINDRNNPHHVTAAQTGAYSKAECDDRIREIITEMLLDTNNNNKLKESVIPISSEPYNQLRWNKDGLYYGVAPSPATGNVYVDAINGLDTQPTIDNGAGSRAKPFKTLRFAIDIGDAGTDRTINLLEGQEHVISAENGFANFNGGKTTIIPYGPNFDVLPKYDDSEIWQSPEALALGTTIKFTGRGNSQYTPNLSVFNYTNGSNDIVFKAINLKRDLSWSNYRVNADKNGNIGIHSPFSREYVAIFVNSGNSNLSVTLSNCSVYTDNTVFAVNNDDVNNPITVPIDVPFFFNDNDFTTSQIRAFRFTDGTIDHISGNNLLLKISGPKSKYSISMDVITPDKVIEFMKWNKYNDTTSWGDWKYFQANFLPPNDDTKASLYWRNGKLYTTTKVNGINTEFQIFPAIWADTVY